MWGNGNEHVEVSAEDEFPSEEDGIHDTRIASKGDKTENGHDDMGIGSLYDSEFMNGVDDLDGIDEDEQLKQSLIHNI